MKCATCKKEIEDSPISAADRYFCSDICHLRYWKEELPNLGGNWISDEMLEQFDKLKGQERSDQYAKINTFILDHMLDTNLFFKMRMSDPKDDE